MPRELPPSQDPIPTPYATGFFASHCRPMSSKANVGLCILRVSLYGLLEKLTGSCQLLIPGGMRVLSKGQTVCLLVMVSTLEIGLEGTEGHGSITREPCLLRRSNCRANFFHDGVRNILFQSQNVLQIPLVASSPKV